MSLSTYLLLGLLLLWYLFPCVSSVCTKPRIRRAWHQLTLQDQHLYIRALKLAYESGFFDRMSEVHWANVNFRYAHQQSGFFPWHRWFIYKMENYLRTLGPEFECITLTYWDWEYHNGDMYSAGHILNPYYFGSITNIPGCVTDGFFVGWTPGEDCVRRTWDRNYTVVGQKDMVDMIVNYPHYGIDAHGFRSKFEAAPHSNVHNWLGGNMGTSFSTYDPIFYHHHSNVDRMYSMWQDCHDYDRIPQEELGFDQYAGSDPDYNGIDTILPFGSKYVTELLTPRILHHIEQNKMIEMEYKYSPHRFPGLINQHYQNNPCKWNWFRPLQPDVPASEVRVDREAVAALAASAAAAAKQLPVVPDGCENVRTVNIDALQVGQENEADGSFWVTEPDKNTTFGYDPETKSEAIGGFRFSVEIPKDVHIISSQLHFVPAERTAEEPVFLKILVEDTDDSESFTDHRLSSRNFAKKTAWTIREAWNPLLSPPFYTPSNPPPLSLSLSIVSSPDVSGLLQSVVDRLRWERGNAVSFVIRGVQPNRPSGRQVSADPKAVSLSITYCSFNDDNSE